MEMERIAIYKETRSKPRLSPMMELIEKEQMVLQRGKWRKGRNYLIQKLILDKVI